MEDIKNWEFYEKLNEIVYVADMDSYDLVYMNRRAREMCGISSRKELKGRKCYELFSESCTPCAFCNNKKLKPGCFLEEMRYHPVMKRRFALKQTMLEEGGKRYRFEIAVDLSAWERWSREYEANAVMVNEGLRISLSAHTPDKSLRVLLEYLGQTLKSDRVYIFEESERGTLSNTYEWCACGVVPQKDNLQDVPFEAVETWYWQFNAGESVIIENLEDIREEYPVMYGDLKPQNIHSMVVSPLVSEERVIGFYGVDNPPESFLESITALFQILGHFMVSIIHRRNHVRQLEDLCFRDQLTGVGNRHAMNKYVAVLPPEESIGVLFCDVMGLKRTNDTQGHQEGDRLLVRASQCLKEEFKEYALFRIGGDEFLALCAGIGEREFIEKVERVRHEMHRKNASMAIGRIWRCNGREEIDKLITQTDNLMYEDKRTWYEQSDRRRQNCRK